LFGFASAASRESPVLAANKQRQGDAYRALALSIIGHGVINMDSKTAETLLDTLAWMSIVIDKFGYDLALIDDLEERETLIPDLKGLLLHFYNLKDSIGLKYPELHPDYLGLENYSTLRKKYETPEVKVKMPTEEEIDKAAKLWQRLIKLEGG
tara:strand:+ start:584 stop:1042 length:459 start_codon:yes stop_codon:yes gene_type:complete